MSLTLLHGDCLKVMSTLEENSLDSLVTDPPAGISFMGKHWDHDKGGFDGWTTWMTEVMREALRVLKPGAHGLVWAIPRTSHWTGYALEKAGFEVRDIVSHFFGTGFPKSLDVSKAMDKAVGAERKIIGLNPNHRSLKPARTMCGQPHSGEGSIDIPASANAKQWSGWGTALKPACEMWFLVRKPCSEKTVAKNVIKWGTGALNIDASRIDPIGFTTGGNCKGNSALHMNKDKGITEARQRSEQHSQGRFPSNLILSHSPYCTEIQCDIECAIEMLDRQSGNLGRSAGGNAFVRSKKSSETLGAFKEQSLGVPCGFGDSGGASRFFYCSKVSSSERGDSKHPTMKSLKLMRYLIRMVTPPKGIVLDPFTGSGSTGVAAKELGFGFLGIEMEKEYMEIAEKRMEAAEVQL